MKTYLIILTSILSAFEYPDLDVTINGDAYPGDIFISSVAQEHQFLAILDSNMDVKWHIAVVDGKGWDFKVNNNDKLTYFQKPTEGFSDIGLWYVLDSNMQEVDTLECLHGYDLDYHDIQYTDTGGYILQAYGKEAIDIPQTAHIDTANILILQEFDQNHNLLLEWKNSDYMDIEEYIESFNLNANYLNWMHGNSIEIDYDDNIIVSNRAMSEAIKFDRLTGELIWRLGGPVSDFTFINDTYEGPSKQHDVRRLDNGNLMIFDNQSVSSANSDDRKSRISEYSLNEDSMTATLVWEYFHPEEHLALNQGCSQRLDNGNTLISWGTVSGHGAIITEVNYQQEIVLEIEYPPGYHSYKVRKSDWEFAVNLIEGDINLDEFVDILDIILGINYIFQDASPDPFSLYKIDLNKDSQIDVSDMILMINIIISE